MPVRLTALRDDERGFTLVEMMVAILLLAIIFAAMVSVIITSLTSMQREEQRVRATQLAQEELERLRAIDWDCAGFDPAGAPYADYNGNTTVVYDIADCPDPASAPSATAYARTVDGIAYTVLPHVYWIDDPEDGVAPADTHPRDYKEFTVDVTWTLRGESYTHTDNSTRVPTVQEVPLDAPAVAGFEITSMSVNPVSVNTTSGATNSAITVVVETSAAASTVGLTVASPSTYGSATLSDISSTAGTRWQITIPSGSTAFPVGTHDFAVTATGAGLGTVDTATTAVTFADVPELTAVTVNAPLLSRGLCARNGNPKDTYYPVTVTVDVSGVTATDVVSLSWTDDNRTVTMTPSGATATGTRFTATMPSGTVLTRSSTTLTVNARRVSDNTVANGSFTRTVTQTNDSGGCPS